MIFVNLLETKKYKLNFYGLINNTSKLNLILYD